MTPIAGRIADMFGKKRVLVLVLAGVLVGTAVAAVAPSLWLLLLARVLQGAGGAVFPLSFGIIRDEFPAPQVAPAIGLVSGLFGIGSSLGIVLSGPILDTLGYSWIFWLPFVVTAVAAAGALLVIPESPVRTYGRLSIRGALLLTGWLVCVLLGVSEAPQVGWLGAETLGLFAAGAVLALVWVRVEWRSAEPLVDMRMMRLRAVWTNNLVSVLVGFGMFGVWILIPQFVETPTSTGWGMGASISRAGLFVMPHTVMMLIVSPFAGRLSNRIGARLVLVWGTLFALAAYAVITFGHDAAWQILLTMSLTGTGLAFAFSAMATLVVTAVPWEQTGVAAGMNTIMRTIGGAFGSQIGASLVVAYALADGTPREDGFTAAFALFLGVGVAAWLAALLVPRGAAEV